MEIYRVLATSPAHVLFSLPIFHPKQSITEKLSLFVYQ